MNKALLNAGEQLPQPPQTIADRMKPEQVNALAMENLLAGTNGEFKCLLVVNMGYVAEPVTEVRDRLAGHYGSNTNIPFPPLGNVRNRITDYLSKGIVDYDKDEDTVRLIEGSEPVVAFAGLLLAASLDSCVPITKVNPVTREPQSWEGFQNLSHLRRLFSVMRIAQSGNVGVTTKKLTEDLGEFAPEMGEANRITRGLSKGGYLKIRKTRLGGRPNNVLVATEGMTEMCQGISNALTLMYIDSAELIKRGDAAIDRVLSPEYVPYLYLRSIKASGHSGAHKLQSLVNRAAIEIDEAPNGQISYRDAYELFGRDEGYQTYEIFQAALSRGLKKQAQPTVVSDHSEGIKKQKLKRAPEATRRFA